MDIDAGSSPGKSAECRICHDEDEDSNMEIPCSCRGSLKFAHRKCVQRWCNEKGDTICEICRKQFKPGYSAPPSLPRYGGIPMNLREDWEVSRSDLNNDQHQQIPMVPTDQFFLDQNFDDYSIPTSTSLMCCRVVAVTFTVLLVLRYTLPFIMYGSAEYSISLLMLLMLPTIGILLPMYIMVKVLVALQHRRNPQGRDEENDELARRQQSHLISVP